MRISLQKVHTIVCFDLFFSSSYLRTQFYIIPISTVCWPRGILLYYTISYWSFSFEPAAKRVQKVIFHNLTNALYIGTKVPRYNIFNKTNI